MNHDDSLFSTDSHTLRRLLAALGRTDQAALPVDLLTIAHTVEQALARRLDLPERAWVDITTTKLRGHVHLLLREDLGDTDAPPAAGGAPGGVRVARSACTAGPGHPALHRVRAPARPGGGRRIAHRAVPVAPDGEGTVSPLRAQALYVLAVTAVGGSLVLALWRR